MQVVVAHGLGVFLAGFSRHRLRHLYLTYGVLEGRGPGFGYVCRPAKPVKRSLSRHGFNTLCCIAAFGAGALITDRAKRGVESVDPVAQATYANGSCCGSCAASTVELA